MSDADQSVPATEPELPEAEAAPAVAAAANADESDPQQESEPPVSVDPAPASAVSEGPKFEQGLWYIINRHSGKALTAVPFAGIAPVIQLSVQDEKVQQFAFRKADHEGCFVVNCLASGLVFDVDSASVQDGAPVVQYRRTDGPNQSFSLEPAEDGKHHYIVAHHSGKVLEIEDGSNEEGIVLIQSTRCGKDHQQFLIIEPEKAAEFIKVPEITSSDLINLARDGRFHDVIRLIEMLGVEKAKPLLDQRPDHRRYALIHQAAWWGHVPTLQVMADLGADLNLKSLPADDHGPETALEIATWRGNLEAVVFLKSCELTARLSQLSVDAGAAPGSPKPPAVAAGGSAAKAASNDDGPVAKECVVCLSAPPNCVFVPCGHLVCCLECANALEKPQCPFCMTAVLLKQKVYV